MRHILAVALLSSLSLSAAAATSPTAHDASAPPSRPISTGVTSPRLIHSTHIVVPADELPSSFSGPASVELKLHLDETGSPKNIQVTRSLNPQLDAHIVEAVRQFRWVPAVLDNHVIPVDLNLIVNVQK